MEEIQTYDPNVYDQLMENEKMNYLQSRLQILYQVQIKPPQFEAFEMKDKYNILNIMQKGLLYFDYCKCTLDSNESDIDKEIEIKVSDIYEQEKSLLELKSNVQRLKREFISQQKSLTDISNQVKQHQNHQCYFCEKVYLSEIHWKNHMNRRHKEVIRKKQDISQHSLMQNTLLAQQIAILVKQQAFQQYNHLQSLSLKVKRIAALKMEQKQDKQKVKNYQNEQKNTLVQTVKHSELVELVQEPFQQNNNGSQDSLLTLQIQLEKQNDQEKVKLLHPKKLLKQKPKSAVIINQLDDSSILNNTEISIKQIHIPELGLITNPQTDQYQKKLRGHQLFQQKLQNYFLLSNEILQNRCLGLRLKFPQELIDLELIKVQEKINHQIGIDLENANEQDIDLYFEQLKIQNQSFHKRIPLITQQEIIVLQARSNLSPGKSLEIKTALHTSESSEYSEQEINSNEDSIEECEESQIQDVENDNYTFLPEFKFQKGVSQMENNKLAVRADQQIKDQKHKGYGGMTFMEIF